MNRPTQIILSITCITLAILGAGCASVTDRNEVSESIDRESDSAKLAHRYQSAHMGYRSTVHEESLNIAPEESDGLNLKHRAVASLIRMEAEELRFALDTDPERIDLGPDETPWVMVGQTLAEIDGVSKKTKQRFRILSAELGEHPNVTRIHAITRQAAGTPKCKSAWQAKDKKLVTITRDIRKFIRNNPKPK